ncbi:RICIN domain-containing protein [Leptolyngbya sp. GB1-A1]|uniref:RICIN domain-containing protein n=1 Tax=Leptolyngbya sp. GB1-A1 TaxID=2933908 RepID=UPI0032995A44
MKGFAKAVSGSLVVGLSLTALAVLNQPSEAQITSGQFLNNTLSGKCIDVAGGPGQSNGSPLQLWDCELSGVNPDNGSPTDQQWVLTRGGFIQNTLSGKCIDVGGAPGRSNGARLILWDCEFSGRNSDNGSVTDQRWTITSNGFIRNTLSGKCIDVAGAPGRSNGAPLQLWDCELSGRNLDNGSTTDQGWSFTN